MSWVLDQEQLHITIGATPQTGEPVGQKLDLDNFYYKAGELLEDGSYEYVSDRVSCKKSSAQKA
jgi:hypothetical protein